MTEPVIRSDNLHPYPCWIIINEYTHPFKEYELGSCQTINNEGINNSKFKTVLE